MTRTILDFKLYLMELKQANNYNTPNITTTLNCTLWN